MKYTLLFLFLFSCSLTSFAQKEDSIYINAEVDTVAEFPGGTTELILFTKNNLSYSPSMCEGLGGKVFIKFVIEKDGSITNVEIIKYPSHKYGKSLADEAVRVVKLMPNWKPAIKDGKPVRSVFVIPFNFKI